MIHSIRIATIGTVNRSIVDPREVLIEAIRDDAAAVIVAHNHPSGAFEPSEEYREVTRGPKEAGNILGIPIPDHLVSSWRAFYSFLQHDEL